LRLQRQRYDEAEVDVDDAEGHDGSPVFAVGGPEAVDHEPFDDADSVQHEHDATGSDDHDDSAAGADDDHAASSGAAAAR
jgi:hypothetical protein